MSSIIIHQPEYLPWINLFLKAAASDIFVFLDTAQYNHRSFQNRNRIKTNKGARWLTVPLKYAPRQEIIKNLVIDNSEDWKRKHLELMKDSYKFALYYEEIFLLLEPEYARKWENLSDLNCNLTMKISKILGLNIKFIRSSELDVEGKGSKLILNICHRLGIKRYISGIGAKAYLNEEDFEKSNIEIVYLAPLKLEYNQVYSEIGFIPDLSIIDYLFNKGVENFKAVAKKYVDTNVTNRNPGELNA